MSVPKCYECDNEIKESYMNRYLHFCKQELWGWRYVSGSESKTSPKWCPKRKAIPLAHG